MSIKALQQTRELPPNHHTHMGIYLRELREYFGLSSDDVAHSLRLHARYIEAIETGDIDELPGKVYARGYVHKYAEFLGLNGAETVEQYAELSAAQTPANDFVLTPEETEQLKPKRWSLWIPMLAIAAIIALWLSWDSVERGIPSADVILSETHPAASDRIVRPASHQCGDALSSPLPCWSLQLAEVQHGFSPKIR